MEAKNCILLSGHKRLSHVPFRDSVNFYIWKRIFVDTVYTNNKHDYAIGCEAFMKVKIGKDR